MHALDTWTLPAWVLGPYQPGVVLLNNCRFRVFEKKIRTKSATRSRVFEKKIRNQRTTGSGYLKKLKPYINISSGYFKKHQQTIGFHERTGGFTGGY
jgi:hypothetical protein